MAEKKCSNEHCELRGDGSYEIEEPQCGDWQCCLPWFQHDESHCKIDHPDCTHRECRRRRDPIGFSEEQRLLEEKFASERLKKRISPKRRKVIRETVGKIATDLLAKEMPTRDPIELEREMHKGYEDNVMQAVSAYKKDWPYDFFVVVDTKREKILSNVLRHFFYGRKTCPTPFYDQTVYRYDAKLEKIDFVWTIPGKDVCEVLKDNALIVDKAEHELLKFVLDFSDGTLMKQCMQLNGELEK